MHFIKRIAILYLSLNTQAFALGVGDAVPDFELPQSLATHKLSELKGKWVYLDFWTSWCAPCRQSFPWMNQMQTKYGSKDFQILAVNLDAKKTDADRFLTQTPANFLLAYDSRALSAKLMELKAMPTSYLINPQGKVAYIHIGFRNEDRELLESTFKSLTTN